VPRDGRQGRRLRSARRRQGLPPAVDAKAPLKDPKDYTIVGQSIHALDIPDKVTGRFTYMQDFRRKGMLHARVIRPRAMKASLMSWNDFECRKIPGYVGAVKKGNFIAVLGRTEWAAIAASRAIDATWSDWAGLPDQTKLWDTCVLQGRQGRRPAKGRRCRRGIEDAERKARQGELRLRDPHARVDRPVVRGSRVRRRQAHVLDSVAADASVAQAGCDDARHEAGRRALHLHRRARAATAATGTRTPRRTHA
jgi:CO/xanthine dehydrogenase Mo-binding subunit